MSEIPAQLHGLGRFIKIEPEGKAPEDSPEGPFFDYDNSELAAWINSGGNVGLNLGELVAIDIDSQEFLHLVNEFLPTTFTVQSGGGGSHRYYRSDWSGRSQFSADETDMGSLRSGNWYTVIPPSIHPTGEPYRVLQDTDIVPVPSEALSDLVESSRIKFGQPTQPGGGGDPGGGGGGSVGGIPSVPSEYPQKEATWSTARKWLSANGLLKSLNRTTSSDWSGLEFKLAKCLAEGGFSEKTISDALDRLHHNSKWYNRGSDYRTRTVRKAIVAAVNDPYVDYSDTGDMTGNTVESRKTEESGEGRTLSGGEDKMTNFTETESVLAKESDDEGSTAVKAVKVEGKDGEDEFSFVSLRKGKLRERETADGGTALVVDIDDTNGSSIGSPDDLDVLIDALEQLKEELD